MTINGMNHSSLQRYTKMRQMVHEDIKTLDALSNMMTLLKSIDRDKVLMDPHSIARIHEIMNRSVLSIWEKLDDFLPLVSAELALEEAERTTEDKP